MRLTSVFKFMLSEAKHLRCLEGVSKVMLPLTATGVAT